MPKPKFVLCCESISHDKTSNLISLFNVLEGFQVITRPITPPKMDVGQTLVIAVPMIQFTGVAVWEQSSDAEGGGEFDYEIELHVPGVSEPHVTIGKFRFNFKRHYRFQTRLEIAPSPKIQSGDIRFVSKVRPTGTTRWKSQEYSFPLTIEPHEDHAQGNDPHTIESNATLDSRERPAPGDVSRLIS